MSGQLDTASPSIGGPQEDAARHASAATGGSSGGVPSKDSRSGMARLMQGSLGRNVGLLLALVILCIVGFATAGSASPASTTCSRSSASPPSSAC